MPPVLSAQENSFDAAAKTARADLESALDELRETREAIASEKIPLVRRQRQLESEVAGKRREAERLRHARDVRRTEFESLGVEAARREEQHHYLQSLLAEYLRDLEASLPVSEMAVFGPRLRSIGPSPDDTEDKTPSLAAELEAVRLSLDRLREQIGGRSYEGDAVGADGIVESGRFLEIGPVVVFAGPASSGLTEERVGSLTAHVVSTNRMHAENIRQLVDSGGGTLPLDATLGNASRRAEASATLWDRLRQGGIVMIPILALAAIALVVAILKWIQIAGMREAGPETLQEILSALDEGRKGDAAGKARAVAGPVGELLQSAVANAHERKELIEEILYETILRAQPRLDRYLPFLALTAAAAPLLGLLGTVTGMINTFQLITLFGTGDARTLSGGISEALITTQFGLGVAIVALLVHALLSRKSKRVIASMEQTEAAFLNGLPELLPAKADD